MYLFIFCNILTKSSNIYFFALIWQLTTNNIFSLLLLPNEGYLRQEMVAITATHKRLDFALIWRGRARTYGTVICSVVIIAVPTTILTNRTTNPSQYRGLLFTSNWYTIDRQPSKFDNIVKFYYNINGKIWFKQYLFNLMHI